MAIEVKDMRGIDVKIIGGDFATGLLDIKELSTGRIRQKIPVINLIADGDIFEIKREYNKLFSKKSYHCEVCNEDILSENWKDHKDFTRHLRNYNLAKKNMNIVKDGSLFIGEIEKLIDKVIRGD
jgi:hypothetical protein